MHSGPPVDRLSVRVELKRGGRIKLRITPTEPAERLNEHLNLKWEGRIGRRRGDGGIRVSANASREGRRVPDRDDGVCLCAS